MVGLVPSLPSFLCPDVWNGKALNRLDACTKWRADRAGNGFPIHTAGQRPAHLRNYALSTFRRARHCTSHTAIKALRECLKKMLSYVQH